MNIAILAKNLDSYCHQRILSAGKRQGHSMQHIDVTQCYMKIASSEPKIYHQLGQIEHIAAIIPRIEANHTAYGSAVLRHFESFGIYSLNSALAFISSRDKLRALQMMTRKNIPMPLTSFVDNPLEPEKLIELAGGAPLIIKLLKESAGRDTIFAETNQAAISVINAFKQLQAKIMVQQWIQAPEQQMIKAIVIGSKVIASIECLNHHKVASDTKHLVKHYAPIVLNSAEEKMAIKALKVMKLNMASINLIRVQHETKVIAIEPSPDFEIFDQITHQNIALEIIKFIENQFTK